MFKMNNSHYDYERTKQQKHKIMDMARSVSTPSIKNNDSCEKQDIELARVNEEIKDCRHETEWFEQCL